MRPGWLTFLLLVPLGAHAGWELNTTGATVAPSKGGFTVQLPPGWNYDTAAQVVLASCDGPLLDSITIQLRPHKEAFKAIKKKSSPESLPEDLAESYVANLQAQGFAQDLAVLATEPAELAGIAAFRVHVRYRLPESASGAVVEEIVLGAATPKGLLLAKYSAPQIHFFAKSLPAFEAVVGTVQLD